MDMSGNVLFTRKITGFTGGIAYTIDFLSSTQIITSGRLYNGVNSFYTLYFIAPDGTSLASTKRSIGLPSSAYSEPYGMVVTAGTTAVENVLYFTL